MAENPILLVEDSDDDYLMTLRAFNKAMLRNEMIRVSTGDEALDYLYQKNQYAQAKKPLLILLDLNLPGTDGKEVLRVVKNDETLKSIPVVVLTTSNDERDINVCYLAGANTYIKKPVEFTGFLETIASLKNFWLEVSILPKV